MKKLAYLLIAPAFLLSCGGGDATDTTEATDTTAQVENVDSTTLEAPAPKSPRLQASGLVNGVQVDIDYGSPYVKGRVIWGELVPYDKIWRAGANDATAITFGADAKVNGSDVKAGTYALFITPKASPDKWTVTLNEEWSKELHGVWGAYDHKPEKDVLKFDVAPVFGEEVVESLTFSVTEKAVMFQLEKASLSFEVKPKK